MQSDNIQGPLVSSLVFGSWAQVVLVVLDPFLRVKSFLDFRYITLGQERLTGLLKWDNTIENVLLEHEVLYSLLVVNQVEVLHHQISLVIVNISLLAFVARVSQVWGTPLVPAPASFLKAADKLYGLRPWQLSQSTAPSDTSSRALGWVLNLMPHLHVHEVVHAQAWLWGIVQIVIHPIVYLLQAQKRDGCAQ